MPKTKCDYCKKYCKFVNDRKRCESCERQFRRVGDKIMLKFSDAIKNLESR